MAGICMYLLKAMGVLADSLSISFSFTKWGIDAGEAYPQGFSGMNWFNRSTWSKVQCEMILAFLSFADHFRPRHFLLENVRKFVSFNKGQALRLSLASLLDMGYQVRFGILETRAFGVWPNREREHLFGQLLQGRPCQNG